MGVTTYIFEGYVAFGDYKPKYSTVVLNKVSECSFKHFGPLVISMGYFSHKGNYIARY